MLNRLNCSLLKARNGQVTVKAGVTGKIPVYLHSSVDPAAEAAAWADSQDKQAGTVFLVLGLGLGYHVEALLERLPANSMIVILHTEMEAALLRQMAATVQHRWFKDKRVILLQLINVHDMGIMLGNIMLEHMLRRVQICCHYPCMSLAEAEYKEVEQNILPQAEQAFLSNLNTNLFVAIPFLQNYWSNLPEIASNPGIASYKKAFQGLPAIVVASGPSLNKNIDELRRCQDRAVIIAAGTAVGALSQHGIRPDFVIISDATFGAIRGLDGENPPVAVFSTQAKHELVAGYQGSKCFFAPDFISGVGLEDCFPQVEKLKQTISVSTGAVDFAVYAGAKQVILVGQDLAFPNNQEYADGVQGGGYVQRDRVMIDAFDGGQVPSTQVFKMVVDYYNQYVPGYPQVNFINATEGGALIAAIKNMPLALVARRVLPPKAINKSFNVGKVGKKENTKNINSKEILNVLSAAKQVFPELTEFVHAFTEPAAVEKTKQQEAVSRYRDFFTRLVILKGYTYIAAGIKPHLDMLYFLRTEGLPLEGELVISHRTVMYITNFVEWFNKVLENNIVAFTGFMENDDEKDN